MWQSQSSDEAVLFDAKPDVVPPSLFFLSFSKVQSSFHSSVYFQCPALCLAPAGAKEMFAELKQKVNLFPTLSNHLCEMINYASNADRAELHYF